MVSDQKFSNNFQTEDKLKWKHSECNTHNFTNTTSTTEYVFKFDTCVPPKETIPSTFFKYDNNIILTDTQQPEMAASAALPAIIQNCLPVMGKVVTRQHNIPVILI